METFTSTLDGFIGQALEEWGTPKSAERPRPLQPHNNSAKQSTASKPARGAGTGARGTPALKQTHMTAFMSRVNDASGTLADARLWITCNLLLGLKKTRGPE
jgi:hypothetical protein